MKFAMLLSALLLLTGCANMGPKIASNNVAIAAVTTSVALAMHKPTPCAKKTKTLRSKCEAQSEQLKLAIANAGKG